MHDLEGARAMADLQICNPAPVSARSPASPRSSTAAALLRRLVLVVLAALCWPEADASPGDVYVPAHRTRDGHYVPPNVPPLSAGTRLARQPSRGATPQRQTRVKHAAPPVAQAGFAAR
jgi:hypothetical protein